MGVVPPRLFLWVASTCAAIASMELAYVVDDCAAVAVAASPSFLSSPPS
jgi:hypothetical protein